MIYYSYILIRVYNIIIIIIIIYIIYYKCVVQEGLYENGA